MEDKKFYAFPHIEQFKSVIHAVQYKVRYRGKDEDGEPIFEDCPLPTLKFRGSVKMHGTNAGIVFVLDDNGALSYTQVQSRENIITPLKDNAGFATFVNTTPVWDMIGLIPLNDTEGGCNIIRVYGEWCGGSIQKGVALNQLGKMFVIFAVKVGEAWLGDDKLKNIKLPEYHIYNILDYPTYEVEIDFNNPKVAADYMGTLVEAVEKECPVGKAFGVSGIGEGIVWMCQTEWYEGSRFWFKTKGDEHKVTSTKEKVPIDIERVNSIKSLVDIVVTEPRLFQGLDYIKGQGLTLEKRNVGPFLKWMYEDIVREELDTIVGNGFEPKEISSSVSNKARDWFFKKIDEEVGL